MKLDARKLSSVFAVIVVLSVVLVRVMGAQDLTTTRLRNEGVSDSTILPGTALALAVEIVSRTSRAPIGFEGRETDNESVAIEQAIDLRGLAAVEALQRLLGSNGDVYTWQVREPIISVRPTNVTASFLDRGMFELADEELTLGIALARAVQSYLPGLSWLGPGTPRPDGSLQPPVRPINRGPLMSRTVSLSTEQRTVREFLDAVIAAHGAAGWSVSHRRINLGDARPDVVLKLYSFDGNSVSRSIPAYFARN